jgi:uncharacterized protein
MSRFSVRYGPWALIAGAAMGLGRAFARALAARGLNLVLLDQRPEQLEELAAEIRTACGVSTRTLALDLAHPELQNVVTNVTADIEVGLLVCNAASVPIGSFLEGSLAAQLSAIDVNCRAPTILIHMLGQAMLKRGRGGIILMTSLAGGQGNACIASYAATKAFNLILAESLWAELQPHGVDVLACRAGATRTPGFVVACPKHEIPLMETDVVAETALASLRRGPVVIPGALNKVMAFTLTRLLPRRASVRLMSRMTRWLYT